MHIVGNIVGMKECNVQVRRGMAMRLHCVRFLGNYFQILSSHLAT